RWRWINCSAFQILSGFVNYRYFTTGAESGINAHHHFLVKGRLHQQIGKIGSKSFNGVLVGPLGQVVSQFPFQRREKQSFVGIFYGILQLRRENTPVIADNNIVNLLERHFIPEVYVDKEYILPLTAVDGQNLVGLYKFGLLRKFIIIFNIGAPIDGGILFGLYHGMLPEDITQLLANLR